VLECGHMKKFVVMYRVPVETMEEWKKTAQSEQAKAEGKKLEADMIAWFEKNKASIVDNGLPLGKNTRMDSAGGKPMTNDLNYYNVMQAESIEQVKEILKDNPHLTIPTAFLDIMEVTMGQP
jgi:hypothetical protein